MGFFYPLRIFFLTNRQIYLAVKKYIRQQEEAVQNKVEEIFDRLKKDFSVKVDRSEKSPGWKFAEQEMRGIPVRIEIGPKDVGYM